MPTPATVMSRVLVASDRHPPRRRLRAALEGAGVDVLSARSGFEAIQVARTAQPDAVLLDVGMTEPSAVELARRLCRGCPVVVLGDDGTDALPFLEAGARGFLPTDVAAGALVRAVAAAVRGEPVIGPELTLRLLERLWLSAASASRHDALTARETQVLDLLARGASTLTIAEHLTVSTETVRSHVKSILRKLGVRSRAEAVAAVA